MPVAPIRICTAAATAAGAGGAAATAAAAGPGGGQTTCNKLIDLPALFEVIDRLDTDRVQRDVFVNVNTRTTALKTRRSAPQFRQCLRANYLNGGVEN